MKVAVLFDRFGPYHTARLEAAAKYLTVFAIEVSGETSEYQWDKVQSKQLINRITLFEKEQARDIPAIELKKVLWDQLTAIRPDVVAINGWADRSALSALDWCLEKKVPSVVMSESAQQDEKRNYWKELIKAKLVRQFSAALVGGNRHVDYLVRLGMNKRNIFLGYDVVDNDHFLKGATIARQQQDSWRSEKKLPLNYFLIVSRFIEKKNLPFVLEAYHQYFGQHQDKAWHLFIVGDGPLKAGLVQLTNKLGLGNMVHFEGFKQYQELPIYFGLAKALLHASTTEQWGLVVNEAMASGLPVVISERCGCVPELVHNEKNGFSFDPYNQAQLVSILKSLTAGKYDIEAMGRESLSVVSKWNADAFGTGLYSAAEVAVKLVPKQHTFMSKFILRLLTKR